MLLCAIYLLNKLIVVSIRFSLGRRNEKRLKAKKTIDNSIFTSYFKYLAYKICVDLLQL